MRQLVRRVPDRQRDGDVQQRPVRSGLQPRLSSLRHDLCVEFFGQLVRRFVLAVHRDRAERSAEL